MSTCQDKAPAPPLPRPCPVIYPLAPPLPAWPRPSLPIPLAQPHLSFPGRVSAQACLQLPHHHLTFPLGDGPAALITCGHQPIEVARGQSIQL